MNLAQAQNAIGNNFEITGPSTQHLTVGNTITLQLIDGITFHGTINTIGGDIAQGTITRVETT